MLAGFRSPLACRSRRSPLEYGRGNPLSKLPRRPRPPIDENPILPRIAEGDETAVQEALDRFGGLVWSLARRFCRATADAEDAVQEVFIELWSHAGRYDPSIASETTFVSMLARRRLIDRLRRKTREPASEPLVAAEQVVAGSGPTVQEQLEVSEESARAAELIQTLRPEQQEVLKLAIYGGWSHQQISEHLSLPLGTVKTHVRRGLIQVREKLGKPAQPDSSEVRS